MINMLRFQAHNTRRSIGQPKIGIVSSTSMELGSVKVILKPENFLTGWLPVISPWAGSGWGMVCPLVPGDQVLIVPQEGDAGAGVVVGCLFSNARRPPSCEAGELLFRHRSGSSILLQNSGKVVVTGDLYVTGQVFDHHGSLDQLRDNYNAHLHRVRSNELTSFPTKQD